MNQKPRGSPINNKKSLNKALYLLSNAFSTCADLVLPVRLSPHLIPTYLISRLLHGPQCYPTIPQFFLATQLFLLHASCIPCLPVHLFPLLLLRPFYQPRYCPTQSNIFLTLQPQLLPAFLAVFLFYQPLLAHLTTYPTHLKVL